MISQAAIAAHIFSIQHVYQITPADRVLQFASFSFDTSIEQILTALLHGATLVMRGDGVWGADEAAQKLATGGVTVANFPTAYWHVLVSQWASRQLPLHQLRLCIVGGEAMQPTAAQQWGQSPLRHIRLLNAYGPTETTVTALVYEVGQGSAAALTGAGEQGGITQLPNYPVTTVPIGRPLPNRTAVILDKYGRPTPVGIPGEHYLGGIGLAQGYRNQPELTDLRFTILDLRFNRQSSMVNRQWYRTGDLAYYLPDGTIVFAGRVDEQVKVRGYRIELGEIEAAIRRAAGVQDTAVLIHTTATNDKQLVADKLLVAYVVGTITETQLRSTLSTQLPHYMLPSAIVLLDALPLTANGKINRRALPAPQMATTAEFTPPRDAVEEEVAGLWTAVLHINAIGRDDNFFQLGGDSLKATRLAAHLSRAFRLDVPLRSLFAAPTVAQFAADLVAREDQPGQIATIARLRQQINQMSQVEIEQQIQEKQK
jgi:acyl-CoA synthetase (AMP-forming)/AMP-acid ligase II/aryl carrier-like protein